MKNAAVWLVAGVLGALLMTENIGHAREAHSDIVGFTFGRHRDKGDGLFILKGNGEVRFARMVRSASGELTLGGWEPLRSP